MCIVCVWQQTQKYNIENGKAHEHECVIPQPMLLRWHAKPLALPFHIVIPKRFALFLYWCATQVHFRRNMSIVVTKRCGFGTVAEKYHIDFLPLHPHSTVLLLMFSVRHHAHKYYSITPDIFKVLNVHLFMQISLIDLLNGYAIFGSIRCISRRADCVCVCVGVSTLIDKKCINGRRWLTAW